VEVSFTNRFLGLDCFPGNLRPCVGPTQVAHLRFVTSVYPTEARNARQEKSGEGICAFLARCYDEP
jgi:hypothetical protein